MRIIENRKAYLFVSLLLFISSFFLHTSPFSTLYSLPYFSTPFSHLAPLSVYTFCFSPFANI